MSIDRFIRWARKRNRVTEVNGKEYIQLFHGTRHYDEVLSQGGKPGVTRENGFLSFFATPDFEVAQEYGEVIFILIPVEDLENGEFLPYIEIFVDGAGDMCVCFVSQTEEIGSDEILVPEKYMIDLKEFWYDYEEELPTYVFKHYEEAWGDE